MISNPMEIIITTIEDPETRKKVQFSDLYSIRKSIATAVFLWNTNSYYVDVLQQIFIINGGRRIKYSEFKNPVFMYRKRNRVQYKTGETLNEEDRSVLWIMGIAGESKDDTLFLEISEDGKEWSASTRL